ncbi:hypothetical protein E1171_03720 [Cytophagales bacterium RKSG123]|nr:hypothetical protein [Xanthovirga aplysinae]
MILSPEEEIALANEAMTTVQESFVRLPKVVYIYDQENRLIHHATGSAEELQQNIQLQTIIAESNFLLEDAGGQILCGKKITCEGF